MQNEDVTFVTETHAPRLSSLAKKGIMLGTSSWIYEGWRGQVYNKDYSGKRTNFLKTRFQKEALSEYSTTFPTTCFDGAYWRFPTYDQLKGYADQTPEGFKMALKVTDTVTARELRERGKPSVPNSSYLDPVAFTRGVLEPAKAALGSKLGPIIFEFSPFFFGSSFGPQDGYEPLAFVRDLHRFLEQIPSEAKYAVEVRDPVLINPPFTRYLDCLNYHGVSHVLNEQTWMPPLEEQIKIPHIFTADFAVVRALVRPGVKHNDAVEEFGPYNRTQLVLPKMRRAITDLIVNQLEFERQLYAYINNRSEGNAPNTIAGVLELLDEFDL